MLGHWWLATLLVIACTASAQIDTSVALVPRQELIPINGFPAEDAANYQAWFNYLVVRSWVETPANTGNINLSPPQPGVAWISYSDKGTIFEPPAVTWAPPFPTINWGGFDHEVAIQDLPYQTWVLIERVESIASAEEDWFRLAVGQANPGLFPPLPVPVTCAMELNDFANRRNAVFGGAGTFETPAYYDNSVLNDAACSTLALFVNKTGLNLIALTSAIKANPPTTDAEFLALLDTLVPEIEGVPPSTWFSKNDPADYGGIPNGMYLGLQEQGFPWFGSSQKTNDSGINPYGFMPVLVQVETTTWGEQVPISVNNHRVCWHITNASGQEVIPPQLGVVNESLGVFLDLKGVGGVWYQQFATGSYLVPVADSPIDLTTCSTDPRLNVTGTIVLVDADTMKSLQPGDLVVAINGPQWGQLPPPGSYQIELFAPSGATLKTWPDDLAIIQNIPKNPDGSFMEVTLKVTFADGTVRIRTFQPDWSQPMKRTIVDKEEPTLLVVTPATMGRGRAGTPVVSASAAPAAIIPGEILSLEGKDFTGNAPWALDTADAIDGCRGNALNDQGTTRVAFTVTNGSSSGKQFLAPMLRCTTTQIDAVVPIGLSAGETVSIQVILNGTPSFQAITTTVEGSPRPRRGWGSPRR
jgi:hypothetical protein